MYDHNNHSWKAYPRLIVFDGVCNFCNASVDFVIRRDPEHKFQFAALQSEIGQQILRACHFSTQNFESFLYLKNGQVFTKSTAALKVAKELRGMWPLFYLGMLVPRPMRDTLYNLVARRRYQWMGKLTACRTPGEADHSRFVS